jgi:hypothetical protein
VNGVQLVVADDVTVGTRAWLTAVLGSEPLSTPVEVRRIVPSSSDDERQESAIGGQLRGSRADSLMLERFVRRAN